jgi:hypothetical protein
MAYQPNCHKFSENKDFSSSSKVIECTPYKDVITKEKFWTYTIRYDSECTEPFETEIRIRASKCTIEMFSDVGSAHPAMPSTFPLAKYTACFEDCLGEQKAGVDAIFTKLCLETSSPEDFQSWHEFWESVPKQKDVPSEIVQPFHLPKQQEKTTHIVAKKKQATMLDDANRPVQVVTFNKFRHIERERTKKEIVSQGLESAELEKIERGNILLVNILPKNNNQYVLPFVIAQVDGNLSGLDTTHKDTSFQIQVFWPTDMLTITNKFIKWKGDDNHLWKPIIKRHKVKMILETKGNKLTAKSLALIRETYPSLSKITAKH